MPVNNQAAAQTVVNSQPKDIKTSSEYIDTESFAAYVLENADESVAYQYISEVVSNPISVRATSFDEYIRLLNEKGIGEKPAILLINEFIPLKTKETSELRELNTENINFNQQDISVTNVVKLIELQNILNKQINKIGSDYLVKNAPKVKIDLTQEEIQALKEHLENFYQLVKKKINNDFSRYIQLGSKIAIVDSLKEDLVSSGDVKLAFLDSLDSDFLFLLCNLCINDIFIKKVTAVIRNINDIKFQHDLTFDFLTFLPRESRPSQNKFSKYFDGFRDEITNTTREKFFLNADSVNRLSSNYKRNNLAQYLNLCSKLASDASFLDSISSIEKDTKELNYNNVKFSSFNDLKFSIDTLKSIDFVNCIHPDSRDDSDLDKGYLNGHTLKNILERTGEDSKSGAIAEVLSALCFDHVSGVNSILGGSINTLISPNNSGNTIYDNIISYIKNALMTGNNVNTNQGNIPVSEFSETLKQNTGFINSLFGKIQKNIDGKIVKTIPFEDRNAILLNFYDDDITDESFKYFVLNELLANNNTDLNEFKEYLSQHKSALENIIKSFINTFSLGFNNKGENKSNAVVIRNTTTNSERIVNNELVAGPVLTSGLSATPPLADSVNQKASDILQNPDKNQYIANNLNPMSFLNYYLQTFAEDLEAFLNTTTAYDGINIADVITERIFSQYFYYNGTAGTSDHVATYSFLGSFLGTLVDEYSDYLYQKESTFSNIQKFNISKILAKESKINIAKVVEKAISNNNFSEDKRPADTRDLSGRGFTHGKTYVQYNNGNREEHIHESDYAKNSVYGRTSFDSEEDITKTNWENYTNPSESLDTSKKFQQFYGHIYKYYPEGYVEGKSEIELLTADLLDNNKINENNINDSITEVLQFKRGPGANLTANGRLARALLFNTAILDQENKENENLSFPNVKNLTNEEVKSLIKGNYIQNVITNLSNNSKIKSGITDSIGSVLGTKNIHLYFIFHTFCLNLIHEASYMEFGIENDVPFTNFSKNRIKGMIDALKGKDLLQEDKGYKIAYNASKQIIDQVKNKIIARNNLILKSLYAFQHQIEKIDDYIGKLNYFKRINPAILRDMQSFLDIDNLRIPFTLSGIKYGITDYNYSFNINKEYFPMPDSNLLSTNETDLKIMYKLFLSQNQGFLQENNKNTKKIFNVGISDLVIEKLYKNAGEQSNLICLIVERHNQIDITEKTLPKYFIFDLSKYILPSYNDASETSTKISNHINNFSESFTYNQLIDSIEFLEENQTGLKSLGTGYEKLVSNGRLGDVLNNYTNSKKEELAQALQRNHILDYYLKLYSKTTIEVDMSECNFPLIDNLYSENSIDKNNQAKNFYQKVRRNIETVALENIEEFDILESQVQFERSEKIITTSPLFNSQARAENNIYNAGCFNRIFSFLLDERDFILQNDNNGTQSENYEISFDGRDSNTQNTDIESQFSVYNFTIKIGLLKRW